MNFLIIEWQAQDKVLKSYSLPLTSIVMRSLDSFQDRGIRQEVIDGLLAYVHTDSIWFNFIFTLGTAFD